MNDFVTLSLDTYNELYDKAKKFDLMNEPTGAVEEEIIDCAKKFKIGDKVYWTPGDSDVVLTITSYDVFDGKKGYKMGGANTAVYWDDELELVNPDENEEQELEETVTHKFNVGDRVEIVANAHGHKFEIGETVRIKEPYDSVLFDYKAESLDGRDWWFVANSDLKLIEEENND